MRGRPEHLEHVVKEHNDEEQAKAEEDRFCEDQKTTKVEGILVDLQDDSTGTGAEYEYAHHEHSHEGKDGVCVYGRT